MKKTYTLKDQTFEVEVQQVDADTITLIKGKTKKTYKLIKAEGNILTIEENGRIVKISRAINSKTEQLLASASKTLSVSVDSRRKSGTKIDHNSLIAPMPGKIFKILHADGSKVKAGETILILEAMKMEHPLKVNLDKEIAKINVKVGDQVKSGQQLVSFREASP